MAFGRTTKKIDVTQFGRKASDIKHTETKSLMLIGMSGTGKTVVAVGGKFKALDEKGNKIDVNIKGFPLPMAILDLEKGVKVEKLDKKSKEHITIYENTNIDEIIAILTFIRDNNEAMVSNGESVLFKTVVVDGVHNIWNQIKSNMCHVKAQQHNTSIVKALGSGKYSSLDNITPEGTEYVPASSLWDDIKKLLIDIKRHANVVVTVGREKNEWGRSITYKVSGHQNDEGMFDVWGFCETSEIFIKDKGFHKKYFFTAQRVRNGISGVTIQDFCYDKINELY